LEHFNLNKITSFDFSKKYKLIKHKNIVFIKIRFQEITRWNEILSEIFQRNIEIKDENISKNKSYYEIFRKFSEYYRIPRTYLDSLKTDKRFCTYNTKGEQKKYIRKWTEKSKS
jgi:hypothetical protein